MFILKFKRSSSKNYPISEKLAGVFENHVFLDDTHSVRITVKELFEKWDYFNLLFWKTQGWVGSSFGYDDYNMVSDSDKKSLFYSLQSAHSMWVGLSTDYLKKLAPVYFDESLDKRIRDTIFNETDTDRLLDLLNAEKLKEEFKDKFGGF